MKTMIMTLVSLLVTTNTAFAADKVITEQDVVNRFIRIEATKDIAGKKNCFNGAIKAKDTEMQESYGGRYSPGTPDLTSILAAEENSRQIDKYCHGYLDKNHKPTNDEAKAAYRLCGSSYSSTYLVAAGYSFSTSGSYGTEALAFYVTVERVMETEVNMNPKGEDDEFKTRRVATHITCQPVALPKIPVN